MPDDHRAVDVDGLLDVVRLKGHCDVDVILLVVVLEVLLRDVLVVESGDIVSNQSDPVEAQIDAFCRVWARSLDVHELEVDVLASQEEVLSVLLLVLGIGDFGVQEHIHQEVSAQLPHSGNTVLDDDRPESVQANKFGEMADIEDCEDSSLHVEVYVPLLGIDVEEEHLEAFKALNLQF